MLTPHNFKLFYSLQTLMNADPQVTSVNISVSMNLENSPVCVLKVTRW